MQSLATLCDRMRHRNASSGCEAKAPFLAEEGLALSVSVGDLHCRFRCVGDRLVRRIGTNGYRRSVSAPSRTELKPGDDEGMAVLSFSPFVSPIIRNDSRFEDELIAFPGVVRDCRGDLTEREEPKAGTATVFISGCCIVIQIARASAASFLLPPTNGRTIRAASSLTWWPSFPSSRAQCCDPPQDSIPITQALLELETYFAGAPSEEEAASIPFTPRYVVVVSRSLRVDARAGGAFVGLQRTTSRGKAVSRADQRATATILQRKG